MNELLPLATYCLVMSSTPGPNNVMLTASGANFGFPRTLPAILGIVVGGALQTVVACLGLGALFMAYPTLHTVLRVAGALYLLVLAWWLTGGTMARSELPRPVSFTQAALFQAVNPKSWIKAITLASVFMPPAFSPLAGALLVSMISLVIGLPCISMYALFGMAIGRCLSNPLRQRIFNAIMGAALAVLAILLIR